jgi:aryl-phospho-beta-D-glucosidase BglC (GH1 family)
MKTNLIISAAFARFRLGVECLEPRLTPSSDPFLQTDGILIRDGHGTGDPVLLQGTNLGSWLVTEGWMSPRDSSGLPDDYAARQTLINRFGADTADSLINTFEDAWITTRDLDNIKALGMNVIRLPFWYRNLENEDGSWRADAFDRMDWLVNNAWARGIYTILDFHGVVGGQSTAEHTGEVRPTAEFWSNADDQARTVDIWQRIADHFRDNPGVAGYDLINEPTGAPTRTALWNMYDRLYQAIRAVDPDHITYIEGTWGSWDWDMLPNPATYGWTNVVYEMHEYQFGSTGDPQAVMRGTDLQVNDFLAHQSWNVPCYIGEFNDFGPGPTPDSVWQYAVQQFQAHDMNWSEWAYKATHGSFTDSWGIYDRNSSVPPVPNLRTDSAQTIASDWAAWTTDNAFSLNPMLLSAIASIGGSPLPAAYSDRDINSPGRVGGAMYDSSSGTWTVWGSGNDIWNNADQFHFAAQPVSGNQTMVAEVTGLSAANGLTKAGVMLRDSWDPGAMFADVVATKVGGVFFQWRDSTGGTCGTFQVSSVPAPTPLAPVWVQLVVIDGTFTAYYSTDGSTWIQVGSSQTFNFSNSTYLAGLAVTAHNNTALSAATFTSVGAVGDTVGDPGFELPSVGTGPSAYQYDPAGPPWTFSGSSGVAGNGSDFTAGNPDAPEGTQVAFVQDYGSISQTVTFASGTYTVNVLAAQRGNGNASSQTLQFLVDGMVVSTFSPVDTNYAPYTTDRFTVPAGAHTISFVGIDLDGYDNTAFLDQVTVNLAGPP